MSNLNYAKEWGLRIKPVRFRQSSIISTTPGWNPFDSDYSRISMSAPFRRLQDKAQVFPLEPNDFVRTRLTHSIEVSGVARSLGVRTELWLLNKEYIDSAQIGHIPSILATSSLAHDIGNPPFGHFGEKCVKKFFSETLQNNTSLSAHEKADLTHFDGNAQGFRLLLRLGLAADGFSYNLTFPTLATIVKYPRDSVTGNQGSSGNLSSKKFGYYQTEKQKYEEINSVLNLGNERHPLCFLLEAADDICYSVSDIEDGLKKRTIDLTFLLETLRSDEYCNDSECAELLKKILESISKNRGLQNIDSLVIQDARAFAQRKMIDSSIDCFVRNHDGIISGTYSRDLIEDSSSAKLRKFFEKISYKNFNHESVIKSELVGDTVIKYLLKIFCDSVTSEDFDDTKTAYGKIYSLISHQSKNAMEKSEYERHEYLRLLMVVDFISGMTDSYALNLYQDLCGLKL